MQYVFSFHLVAQLLFNVFFSEFIDHATFKRRNKKIYKNILQATAHIIAKFELFLKFFREVSKCFMKILYLTHLYNNNIYINGFTPIKRHITHYQSNFHLFMT